MRKVRAFNIRGLGRFPSNGMVKLTSLLNEIPGVSATTDDHGIFGFEYIANLTEACIVAYRSGRVIAINGHSFGANAAIMIATRLAQRNIEVDYLAAIDPAAQFALSVPLNVTRIYNPYQKVDPVGRGVVKPADDESEDHWNARAVIERRNQLHVRIDDDPIVHRTIIAAVKALTAWEKSMFWIIAALIGGYVAAIFTWPTIRAWVVGVDAEIASLRERARVLEAKIKSFTGS